jgi:hypothetical protein
VPFQHGFSLFPGDWCLVLHGNWQWCYLQSCYSSTSVAKCRGFQHGLTDEKYLWLSNFWRFWIQNCRTCGNFSEVYYRRASCFHNNFWLTVNVCTLFLLLTLRWISCGDGALKKNFNLVFWQIITAWCGTL